MAEKDVELNMGPTTGEPFHINSQPVVFRSINAGDFTVIKHLHELFFPITYGDAFYEKTCAGIGIAGEKLFSSLAVLNGEVIGFVLGQFMKYPAKCEDKDMFSTDREPKTVFYILTLGLLDQHRRTGLGSKLIRQCEEFACLDWECGAVSTYITLALAIALFHLCISLKYNNSGVSARDHDEHQSHQFLQEEPIQGAAADRRVLPLRR